MDLLQHHTSIVIVNFIEQFDTLQASDDLLAIMSKIALSVLSNEDRNRSCLQTMKLTCRELNKRK